LVLKLLFLNYNKMKTYRLDEIVNKHNQPIYLFSNQPGTTDMEKYINFLKSLKSKYKVFEATITEANKLIKIVAEKGAFQVFNDKEEKINQYDDACIEITSINDISEDLNYLGYKIK